MDIEAIQSQLKDSFPQVKVSEITVKNQHGEGILYAVFAYKTMRLFLTEAELTEPGFSLAATITAKLGVKPQPARLPSPAIAGQGQQE